MARTGINSLEAELLMDLIAKFYDPVFYFGHEKEFYENFSLKGKPYTLINKLNFLDY